MWAWKYREPVLDILEEVSGNRQSYAMMSIGGVNRDIDDAQIPGIMKRLEELIPIIDMFKGAVLDDPVIHARTKGIGILSKQSAKEYAVVGPTARASGINIDVRRDDAYGAYDRVDWQVITQEEGDVFAKVVVRVLEMYESIKIIKQCLTKMKPEPIDCHVKEIPVGEGIGRVEAPRGECYHYVRSDGTNRPVRHKVRAPSYVNVASNKVAVVGYTVSDAALILAAVDPCYCCTERVGVVDATSKKRLYNGFDLIRLSQEKTQKLKERYPSKNSHV